MAKLLFIFLALSTIVYVSAQSSSSHERTELIATNLSQWLVDVVSRKIVALARLLDLKVRIVKFLVSLFTTQNLVLLRNVIEYAVYFLNYVLSFLPQSVDDPLFGWVPALTEFADSSFGNGALLGAFIGAPTLHNEPDEAESEIVENLTNPPTTFNSTPSSSENEISVRLQREAITETTVDQKDEQVMSLDKLIHARRK